MHFKDVDFRFKNISVCIQSHVCFPYFSGPVLMMRAQGSRTQSSMWAVSPQVWRPVCMWHTGSYWGEDSAFLKQKDSVWILKWIEATEE